MKNVKEIVNEWLIDEGFDGLCNDECGCSINDLAPCYDGPFYDCIAAMDMGPKNGFDRYFEPAQQKDSCHAAKIKRLVDKELESALADVKGMMEGEGGKKKKTISITIFQCVSGKVTMLAGVKNVSFANMRKSAGLKADP